MIHVRTATNDRRPLANAARSFRRSKYLLLLALPALVWYAVFCYVPMYGIQIAFKNYMFRRGIWGSPWVGLQHYQQLFRYHDFWNAVRNTLVISLSKIAISFPIPIILSISLNEIARTRTRRLFQTVYTFPHFISWVIVYTLFYTLISGEGLINLLRTSSGLPPIDFLTNHGNFFGVLMFTEVWKTLGWSTILYCAAITNINPEIMEAAVVDGANRFQRIWYITLPELTSTIVILLILAVGRSMNAGFDQIFNFYNPIVYPSADIIDTYIYRLSFEGAGGFSLSTAVGLFKSIINFALLFGADRLAKAVGQSGIY